MPSTDFSDFQEFLDNSQYTTEGVARYEWIFGETFLSSGGLETTKEIVDKLGLKPGDRVLDVGCGIGGHDFYMAENFGVNIHAIDLSNNMMQVALGHYEKRAHLKDKIKFELGDIFKIDLPEASFDLIYSRDALIHIKEKAVLFAKLFKLLKPGGKFVFTDYGRGMDRLDEASQEFQDYVRQRDYTLFTVDEYRKTLEGAGFTVKTCAEVNDDWMRVLKRELNDLMTKKDDFLSKFSLESWEYLRVGWEDKIQRSLKHEQVWIYAEVTK